MPLIESMAVNVLALLVMFGLVDMNRPRPPCRSDLGEFSPVCFLQAKNGGDSKSSPTRSPFVFIHDFGKVKHGTVARHHFLLANESDSDLRVVNVQVGSGSPVTARLKKHLLRGGEETTLEVVVDARRILGSKSYRINVVTDNGQQAVTAFSVRIDALKTR